MRLQRLSFRSCEFPESSERGESVNSFCLTEQSSKSCCSLKSSVLRAGLVESGGTQCSDWFYRSGQGKGCLLTVEPVCCSTQTLSRAATAGQHEVKPKCPSGPLVAGWSIADKNKTKSKQKSPGTFQVSSRPSISYNIQLVKTDQFSSKLPTRPPNPPQNPTSHFSGDISDIRFI